MKFTDLELSSELITGIQKLGALDCEISSSSGVSFVVKGIDIDDNEIVLGTFTGAIGDLLNTILI